MRYALKKVELLVLTLTIKGSWLKALCDNTMVIIYIYIVHTSLAIWLIHPWKMSCQNCLYLWRPFSSKPCHNLSCESTVPLQSPINSEKARCWHQASTWQWTYIHSNRSYDLWHRSNKTLLYLDSFTQDNLMWICTRRENFTVFIL